MQETAPRPTASYAHTFPPDASVGELPAIFGQCLYFGVVTFGTLGYGDIQPVSSATRALARIDTLVGFALIAVLISLLLRRSNWL